MPTDIERVLVQVGALFESLDLEYAVGGSVASSLYGDPRSTNDIDIVLELGIRGVKPLVAAFQTAFEIEEHAVRRAVTDESAFQLLHTRSFVRIDVFLAKERRLDRLQLSRRIRLPVGGPSGGNVYFITAEDVVLVKLDWLRASGGVLGRQWTDVQGVLKVQGPRLDLPYLRTRAFEVGLSVPLRRALTEAGLPPSP